MKNGTTVFVFDAFDLLKGNVVDLIYKDKFVMAKVFTSIVRDRSQSVVVYAHVIDTGKVIISRPDICLSNYKYTFVPINEVRCFARKYFNEIYMNHPDLKDDVRFSEYVRSVMDKVSKDPPDNGGFNSLDHDSYCK